MLFRAEEIKITNVPGNHDHPPGEKHTFHTSPRGGIGDEFAHCIFFGNWHSVHDGQLVNEPVFDYVVAMRQVGIQLLGRFTQQIGIIIGYIHGRIPVGQRKTESNCAKWKPYNANPLHFCSDGTEYRSEQATSIGEMEQIKVVLFETNGVRPGS